MKNEAQSLTMDQLKQRVKALETETSSMKSEVNRMRKEMSKQSKIKNQLINKN
jgi:3-phenylpropionate/cinnamic acid dioxygenase small subunit